MSLYRLAIIIPTVLLSCSLPPVALGLEADYKSRERPASTVLWGDQAADQRRGWGFRPVASDAELGWSEDRREDYLAEIQALYQTSDPAQALVQHINRLLEFYAYGDKRIIAASRMGAPSRHRIHLSDRGEIITSTTTDETRRQDRLRVFGVNPYVRYLCSQSTASCWIMHPVTSEPWLQIAESREAGSELTKALAELIKQLQAS